MCIALLLIEIYLPTTSIVDTFFSLRVMFRTKFKVYPCFLMISLVVLELCSGNVQSVTMNKGQFTPKLGKAELCFL